MTGRSKVSGPDGQTAAETERGRGIMRRMDEALKMMMSTPPETHAEMVKRRHAGHRHKDEPKRRAAARSDKKSR